MIFVCVFFLHLQLFFSFFILQVVWKYLHCYNFKCKNQLSCILKTFLMHSTTFQTIIRQFVDIWTILQHFFLRLPSGSPKVETLVDLNIWSFIFPSFETYFGCACTLFHSSLQKNSSIMLQPSSKVIWPLFLEFCG